MSTRAAVQESRLRSMFDFYTTTMRTQIQTQFQYRAATYMYTLGMVAEPTIYLVVWRTIANSHGGSVNGIGPGQFAAYYLPIAIGLSLIFHPTLDPRPVEILVFLVAIWVPT